MIRVTKKTFMIGILGLFIGASIGFMCRPSVQFKGKLPWNVVMSRGSNLKGIKKIYLGTARTSFNYILIGGISGAILGIIVGNKLKGNKLKKNI